MLIGIGFGWRARMHPIAETIPCALATCGRAIALLVRSFDLSSLRGVRPGRGGAIAVIAAAALLWPAPPALADFVQQGLKLVGSGSGQSNQGISVALSADGNTAIVGGLTDSGIVGAAWVFTRSGGVWTQQGPKLVASDAVGPQAQQGSAVALSADGNTAIVGGRGDSNFVGAAWVYTRSGGVWKIGRAHV